MRVELEHANKAEVVMGFSNDSTLSVPDYNFALNQRVNTLEGEGIIVGMTKFGFPDGIYLIQLSDEQLWKHPEEIESVEE